MTMTEIATFIRELGVPIAAMVALAVALYKIGTICGKLLIDAWAAKDIRLIELEKRIETVSNGQRSSLEDRFDRQLELQRQSNEVQAHSAVAFQAVATALSRHADKFGEWVHNRPCLHDSDVVALQEATDEAEAELTPNPEDLERIRRQRERKAKREEGKGKE